MLCKIKDSATSFCALPVESIGPCSILLFDEITRDIENGGGGGSIATPEVMVSQTGPLPSDGCAGWGVLGRILAHNITYLPKELIDWEPQIVIRCFLRIFMEYQ